MAPPHQYTTARDGTPLAFRAVGQGPALLFTNGYATSDYYWRDLARHFAPRSRVITWDLKGHGRSGASRDVSIESLADDLARVMDAAQVEHATLLGFSLGCQIMFEAWRQIPDRIDALIPILGTYGKPFDNLLHPRVGPVMFSFFSRLGPRVAPAIPGATYLSLRTPMAHWVNQTMGFMGRTLTRERMRPFYDHFALIDGDTWVAMGVAAQQHTARDVLQTVDVPTLIVAGGRDALTPVRVSRDMHDAIDGAEMLMLDDATHAGLFEFSDEIVTTIDEFVQRHELVRTA